MTDINRLFELFTNKEKLEGFILNLEKLKDQGSLTPEQYLAARQEYDQRLTASVSEISQIKSGLAGRIDAIRRDQEALKLEMNNLESRYRVGEFPLEKYQSLVQSPWNRINVLEQQAAIITRLIGANSSIEIGILQQPAPVAASLATVPSAAGTTQAGLPVKKNGLSGKIIAAIAGGSIIVIALAVTAVVLISGGNSGAKEMEIPINITGASNLGALHLELSYDPDSLKVVSVERGGLVGKASLFQFNMDTPGDLILGVVDSGGISGDGSIALIIFKTTGKYKYKSTVSMENVLAYNASTLEEITGMTTEGSFDPGTKSLVPPELTLVPNN